MKYLPIHSSSSIWLRYDNLWTNLNQFCVNIMELIVFITHIWLYGRFYISEFTCFSFFSPYLCCYIRVYLRICHCDCRGYCVPRGYWKHRGYFLLELYGLKPIAPSPVNLYCTYTVIISSGLPEALNSE